MNDLVVNKLIGVNVAQQGNHAGGVNLGSFGSLMDEPCCGILDHELWSIGDSG